MDAKKLLAVAAGALVVFYAITQPAQATTAVTTLLGWLTDGAKAIMATVVSWFG